LDIEAPAYERARLPSRISDGNKKVFVVKKHEKGELTVLGTLPEDNARQTGD
jgi:hypothetical protein